MAINLLSIEATSTQNERIRGLSCIHTTSPPTAQTGDLISLPERRKMLHGGLPTLNRPIVTRLKSGQIGVDWPVKRRYPGLEAGPISDWPDNARRGDRE